MKRGLGLLVVVMFVMWGSIFANGLNLNSIGPRSLGLGGAFIGLANDATAIYWNPAGLSYQKSSVLLFGSDIMPSATYKWEYPAFNINYDAKSKVKHYASPNFFVNYNMKKFSFGLGVYVPSGIGIEWNAENFGEFKMMGQIGLFSISPAFAYKFSENFSVGIAANIYYGFMKMERPYDPGTGTSVQYSEDLKGNGIGATIGIKYRIEKLVDLGLTYRTPINVKFSGTGNAGIDMDIDRDIEWPMWIGVGTAWHLIENMTMTFDVQYTNWANLEKMITKMSYMYQTTQVTSQDTTEMEWNDATQIRFGIEYLLTKTFKIRAGYYYDPAPAPDKTLSILFPSSTNNVITLGGGYDNKKFFFDFGVEYLFGKDRNVSDELNNPQDPYSGFVNNQPGTHHMDILAFSIGLGYRF